MKKRMFVDPASRSTGWAFYDGHKLVDHGTIVAKSDHEVDRMVEIWNGYREIALRYRPEELYVERMNYKVHYLVQYSCAIVKTVFRIYGDTLIHRDVSPQSWKAFLRRSQQEIGDFGLDAKTVDERVAIVMGHWFFDKMAKEAA